MFNIWVKKKLIISGDKEKQKTTTITKNNIDIRINAELMKNNVNKLN